MSKFIIIRQENEAQELVKFLAKNGYESFVESIFSVENLIPEIDANGVKYAILTSANAISGFLAVKMPKNVRIFTVGGKTAQKLRENGYENVIFAPEMSVLGLEKLVLAENIAENERILYFRGNFVTKKLDFKGLEEVFAYNIEYFDEFSGEFLRFLEMERADYVLLYSKNATKNLARLIKKYNLVEYFKKMRIMGFSKEITAEIKALGFGNCGDFSEVSILKEFYNL